MCVRMPGPCLGEGTRQVEQTFVAVDAPEVKKHDGVRGNAMTAPDALACSRVGPKARDIDAADRALSQDCGFGRRHGPFGDQKLALRSAVGEYVGRESRDLLVRALEQNAHETGAR